MSIAHFVLITIDYGNYPKLQKIEAIRPDSYLIPAFTFCQTQRKYRLDPLVHGENFLVSDARKYRTNDNYLLKSILNP